MIRDNVSALLVCEPDHLEWVSPFICS